MIWWSGSEVPLFVAPLGYVCASAGPDETKNQRKEILRLIQIRLATQSFGKIRRICQARKRAVTTCPRRNSPLNDLHDLADIGYPRSEQGD